MSAAKPRKAPASLAPGAAPDVIVDFIFDEGLLYVAVANISDEPAGRVMVRFEKPFHGVDARDMRELSMFRHIEFLAPRKRIVSLIDSAAAYFARDEPTTVVAEISFADRRGTPYEARVTHDLTIYKDIVWTRRTDSTGPALDQESVLDGDRSQHAVRAQQFPR